MRRAALARWLILCAGLALSLAPVTVAATPPGAHWDPAIEWRTYPRHMNPSPDHLGNPDVWAYMGSPSRSHDPATYYLLPYYQAESADTRLQVWQDPSAGFLHVSRVRTTRHGYFPGEFAPANGMHPGDAGQMSIIAWTSPTSGGVRIEGHLNQVGGLGCPEGSGVTWWIDQGGETLFTGVVALAGEVTFDTSATVVDGDTLYFILDPGDNDMCDTTFVNIGISRQ